jgi:hypothetical protein
MLPVGVSLKLDECDFIAIGQPGPARTASRLTDHADRRSDSASSARLGAIASFGAATAFRHPGGEVPCRMARRSLASRSPREVLVEDFFWHPPAV